MDFEFLDSYDKQTSRIDTHHHWQLVLLGHLVLHSFPLGLKTVIQQNSLWEQSK